MIGSLANFPHFEHAKCNDFDPDFFFPVSREETFQRKDQLLAICNSCIHLDECRIYSIKHKIKDGFWGGLTQYERKVKIDEEKRLHALHDCCNFGSFLDDCQHLVIEPGSAEHSNNQDDHDHETDHHE